MLLLFMADSVQISSYNCCKSLRDILALDSCHQCPCRRRLIEDRQNIHCCGTRRSTIAATLRIDCFSPHSPAHFPRAWSRPISMTAVTVAAGQLTQTENVHWCSESTGAHYTWKLKFFVQIRARVGLHIIQKCILYSRFYCILCSIDRPPHASCKFNNVTAFYTNYPIIQLSATKINFTFTKFVPLNKSGIWKRSASFSPNCDRQVSKNTFIFFFDKYCTQHKTPTENSEPKLINYMAPTRKHNYGLHDRASPVIMATGSVNGRWRYSTPYRIDTS